MVGAIARRHPDRARQLGVLFSYRHLRHSQHFAEFVIVDLPALTVL
jgi:hypothetical protein